MASRHALFHCGQFLGCNVVKPFSAQHVIQHMKTVSLSENSLSAADPALIFYAKGGTRRDNADMVKKVIVDTSQRAFRSKNQPAKAIHILKEMPGVGTSIASAIMSWTFPRQYAVWDKHSANAAAHFGLVGEMYQAHAGVAPYVRFNEAICRFCIDVGIVGNLKLTPQRVDVWLYNYSKTHGLSKR